MSGSAPTGSLAGAFVALVRRDLLLAFRRRTELLFPVIFLLVVISLFPLGIGPGPQLLARIAPTGDVRRRVVLIGHVDTNKHRASFSPALKRGMQLSSSSLFIAMLINTVANIGLATPLIVLSLSLFFLLLIVSALTSSIAVLEPIVAWADEHRGVSPQKGVKYIATTWAVFA